MDWADDIKIETPEQIEVSLEVAGLGSRFVAKAHDWLIKWGVFTAIALALLLAGLILGIATDDQTTLILGASLAIVLFYAFLLGFDIYYEVLHNGQTPGKKAAGIRVIREGGAALDFQASCIRNLLGTADFLPAFYLLGGVIALLNDRGQRLGDIAAGTLVIRERAVQPPAELDPQIERLALEEFLFSAEQLGSCTAEDRYILRSFFQRSRELVARARGQLAFRLVETFTAKMAYLPRSPILEVDRAEGFLAALYRDLENLAKHQRQ